MHKNHKLLDTFVNLEENKKIALKVYHKPYLEQLGDLRALTLGASKSGDPESDTGDGLYNAYLPINTPDKMKGSTYYDPAGINSNPTPYIKP